MKMKEGAPKSKLRTAFEKVATGAALLGVVAAGEAPTEAHAQTAQELHEAFSIDQETKAFLHHIERMSPDYNDSDSETAKRLKAESLRARVDSDFAVFALALSQEIPSFSFQEKFPNGHVQMRGTLTPEMRERARLLLLPELEHTNTSGKPGLEILKYRVARTHYIPSPEMGTSSKPSEVTPPHKSPVDPGTFRAESPEMKEDW